jgi:hypothetical protein
MIKREELISAFDKLGKVMFTIGNGSVWSGYELGVTQNEYERLQALVKRQFHLNGWYTESAVLHVFRGWGEQLTIENLSEFSANYSFASQPKKVGVIMAGNIPLVGFHDFLCVLLSGNSIVIKLSSDDKTLMPALIAILKNFLQEMEERISVSEAKLGEVDAIIATGSGNSMRYFESYFGHLPHLFRKNRTSVAVLTGNETKEELEALGDDIFIHYGLGCRNVSHLILHNDFDINRFFEAIIKQADVVNLHKYANNYDYNKAIYLMNLEQILDNGFVLLKESEDLFSPLAMLFYHRYEAFSEVESYLEKHKEDIQVVVGHGYLPFGNAQCPTLSDFADGVDTMSWLGFN